MKTFKTIAVVLFALLTFTAAATAQRQDPRPDAPRAQRNDGDRAQRLQQLPEGIKERIRQLVRAEVARAMQEQRQQGQRGGRGRGRGRGKEMRGQRHVRGQRGEGQQQLQRGELRQRFQQLPEQMQQRLREVLRGRLQERADRDDGDGERRPARRSERRRGGREAI